jgi:HD-GYP domain-containing protein (c-di-GMP phosphodiesterase class II)
VGTRSVPALGSAAFAACVPVALLHFWGREQVSIDGWIHLGGVGLSAALAVAAAGLLTLAGVRSRDGRAVLVGTAFSVMAALLCLHGLTTPGILVQGTGVVAFTGGATLPVGGAILALTALPAVRGPGAVRPLLALLAASVAAILVLGAAAVLEPALVPSVPEPRSPLALAVMAAGLVFYALLALRALRTYRLTRRPGDLLVAVGIAWLAAALVAALVLDFRNVGWWLGHGFEVVGIALVGVPVALDLRRSAQSRPLVGDLRGVDLVRSEEAFLGSHVRALMVALAAKDAYTEGHVRRVALRAVAVGEELGLSSGRLRSLAAGGLLHDIGKLSVPDEILKKPGPLTESEYAVIRAHPERGRALLRELGGFGEAVVGLVLDHHERLDGSGYPNGLRGGEIGQDARILAVCDVYDALISPRVYRPAWTHERALGLLREGAGAEFDRRVVAALERVLARERDERPELGLVPVAV